MYQLVLIRHGESLANAEGRLQGHLDIPLSGGGRLQSERLAERLAGRVGAPVIAAHESLSDREFQVLTMLAAGKTLTDKEIDSINWYVEGVEGKLPGK